MYFGGYGLYLLCSLPALLLGLIAQLMIKSSYSKYSQIGTYTRFSGAQAARRILDQHGLQNIAIEQVNGTLTDHYDPARRVLRLSTSVFQSSSIASVGVAAHETGHALQHAQGYKPLSLRTAIVPTVQIGSWLGPIVFMAGLFLNSALGNKVAIFGLILFSLTAIFALITLPVEFDASRRAKTQLVNYGIITPGELEGVNKVLNAAALTYVAGAAQAISSILYYALLLVNRRRD